MYLVVILLQIRNEILAVSTIRALYLLDRRHGATFRLVFSFLCLYIMEGTEFDVLMIATSLTESIVAAYAIATHAISQSRNWL